MLKNNSEEQNRQKPSGMLKRSRSAWFLSRYAKGSANDTGYMRGYIVWGLMFGAVALLILFTAIRQFFPDERVVLRGESQYWGKMNISASRGEILDRRDSPLAISVPTVLFFIDPKNWDVQNAPLLREFFGEGMVRKFSQVLPGRYQIVKRNVRLDSAKRIIARKIPGLSFKHENLRVYPHGSLAFHILGYCDIDGHGQAGLEYAWDNLLFIQSQEFTTARMSKRSSDGYGGDVLDEISRIKLTLDVRFQEILEANLALAGKESNVKWATGVIMNPKTGEVLAMASYPTADGNTRHFSSPLVMMNNAVGRNYEPGSIFKPISMSIAIELGGTNKDMTYTCHGSMPLYDKVIHDVNNHAHGHQTLHQVLMNSCNIGMSLMAEKCPHYDAYKMLVQYGFGRKSGIDTAGEEAGLLRKPEEWRGTVTANTFIGQGIGVTAMQMVTAMSAIANGGKIFKPYIVDTVYGRDGKIVYKGRSKVRYQVISKETANFIRAGMEQVVAAGGGRAAKSKTVEIAGKTGTAQVAEHGQYIKGRHNASFIGMWPASAPEYVMVITLGEPTGGRYYGGQIAAPCFKKIVEEIEKVE